MSTYKQLLQDENHGECDKEGLITKPQISVLSCFEDAVGAFVKANEQKLDNLREANRRWWFATIVVVAAIAFTARVSLHGYSEYTLNLSKLSEQLDQAKRAIELCMGDTGNKFLSCDAATDTVSVLSDPLSFRLKAIDLTLTHLLEDMRWAFFILPMCGESHVNCKNWFSGFFEGGSSVYLAITFIAVVICYYLAKKLWSTYEEMASIKAIINNTTQKKTQ